MAAQTESPFMQGDLVAAIFRRIGSAFDEQRLYLAQVPTYSLGLWSFTLGVTDAALLDLPPRTSEHVETRYYTPEIHTAAFALPQFVQDVLYHSDAPGEGAESELPKLSNAISR